MPRTMDPLPEQQNAGIGFRIVVIALAVGIAAIAFSAVNRGGSSRTPAPSTLASTVTLIARNLALVEGEDNAIRIGFRSGGSARLILRFVPDTARVMLCPLTEVTQPLASASCQADIFSGVRQDIATPGLAGVALVLQAGSAVGDLSVDYDATTRDVSIRLPYLAATARAPGCKDNACNPFFELTPVRAGTFSATATWTGTGATLVLLQGSVVGRSLTATGLPYAEPARESGPSPLHLSSRLSAPAEYAIALQRRCGRSRSTRDGPRSS